MLHESGYVDDTIEYPSYSALWRALAAGATPASAGPEQSARTHQHEGKQRDGGDASLGRRDRAVRSFGHRLRHRAHPSAQGSTLGRAARRGARRRHRPRDQRQGRRRARGAAAWPRRADAGVPADGRPDEPGLRPDRAHGRGDDVRSRRQRVVDLRRRLGGRGRSDRRREPGAALARRPGRLPARGRRRLRVGRIGGQPQRTGDGPRRPPRSSWTSWAVGVRRDDGGACIGPRDCARDGRRHRPGRGRRARPNDRRRAASMR